MNARTVYWQGSTPVRCDACSAPFNTVFYDMKTVAGPWGCLCPTCAMDGVGVGCTGTGWGQKYQRQPDGRWLKVEG